MTNLKEIDEEIMDNFFHITNPVNIPSIVRNGIKQNFQGEVFIFNKKKVAPIISKLQLGLENYAIFEIDKTYLSKELLFKDNVGELTSCYQWIYKKAIPKEHVNFLGCFKIVSKT